MDQARIDSVIVMAMADGSRAVLLLNRSAAETTVTAKWTDIGYPAGLPAKVRDLWKHKDLGTFKETYAAAVPATVFVVGQPTQSVTVGPVTYSPIRRSVELSADTLTFLAAATGCTRAWDSAPMPHPSPA